MAKQSFTGYLDLLVLTILDGGGRHGYAVIEELKSRSEEAFDLPEGTVYPALHRLERAGALASDWSVVQGRRRRVYRLTDQGRQSLHAQRKGWVDFSAAVDKVLGGTTWPATN